MRTHPVRSLIRRIVFAAALCSVLAGFASTTLGAEKKVLLIAGKPSHGPGDHEFRAGCLLLQKCLEGVPGVTVQVHSNGWPVDAKAFDGAAAVLIFADGGGGHPAIQADRLKFVDELARKGVGVGFAHYGVEVPKGDPGEAMQRWIGGYYEHQFSVNPMWKPEYQSFPDHPVTRGVKPFALVDEWYFNMRWAPAPKGVTPILVAKPSDQVRKGPYVYPPGPYPHIVEAAGRDETMMWVFERPAGGRGFGFTGGHKHVNWANDNFRKVVLNALLWLAKADVPANGVESSVAPEDLSKNLDPKGQSADAPNVSGKWNVEVKFQDMTGKPAFTLVHAGQNVIGRYQGRLGEADVSGSVKGNEIKWTFPARIEDQPVTCNYKGTIENSGNMKGTVTLGDFEGTWTATR